MLSNDMETVCVCVCVCGAQEVKQLWEQIEKIARHVNLNNP